MKLRTAAPTGAVVQPKRTLGLSPKAVLAFLFPTVASVAGVLSTYVGTGHVDTATLRLAGVGLIASAVAALGAAIGQPGKVELPDTLAAS